MKHEFRVAPDTWRVHHRDDVGTVPDKLPQGISFAFPVSPTPDPAAVDPWVGYVVGTTALNAPIVGTALTYYFSMDATPGTLFNYMSTNSPADGPTPAGFRPMIKTGAWDQMGNSNRYWSDTRWELKASPFTSLVVPLDPATWFDVNGAKANSCPASLAAFQAALKRPTYIGMTFGGGYYAGHGVNVSAGNARFNLNLLSSS